MINGLLCTHIVNSLNNKLLNGRIQKIYQINDNELLFKIRANHTNYQLINNVNAKDYRLHITNHKYETLEQASHFCMILRKYLEGGIIKKISQYQCERIIIMEVIHLNELQDSQTRYLIFELLSRHSNTIICDSDYKIIQVLKNIPVYDNMTRLLHPNVKYEYIDTKNKLNPLLDINNTNDYTIYQGFDKYLNQEFITLNNEGLASKDILHKYLNTNEYNIINNRISLLKKEEKSFNDIDNCFDYIYSNINNQESIDHRFKDIIKEVKQNIKKNDKKIIKLEKEYIDNQDYRQYQILGKLLFDNIYLYNKDKHYDNVKVMDYNTNKEISINLNNKVSYIENAKGYLKKYHKLKTSLSYLQKQIVISKNNNILYHNFLDELAYNDIKDIEETINYLENNKIIRKRSKYLKKKKKDKNYNYHIYLIDDIKIYVGKNNIQNEYLDFKLARKTSTFLHIKNYPGAHVIIDSNNINDKILLYGAKLAVYYAKTELDVSYEVDYTLVKNLKKIKTNTGLVSYDTYKSIKVINNKDFLKDLERIQ